MLQVGGQPEELLDAWRITRRRRTFAIRSFSSSCISGVSSNFVMLSNDLSMNGYTKQTKNDPCRHP